MEIITKYKAFDGIEFVSSNECVRHENNCKEAIEIMKPLGYLNDSCDFRNGFGFLQHDKNVIELSRINFCEFLKRYISHKWLQETIDKGIEVDASWVGRLLSESVPSSIYKHWYRFMCIDKEYREWGQPYYALHPTEGNDIRLN
jgi:hypothetical protein